MLIVILALALLHFVYYAKIWLPLRIEPFQQILARVIITILVMEIWFVSNAIIRGKY